MNGTQEDVRIENHGSLFVVQPMTTEAREWMLENVASEPWQWLGGGLAVEPRYVFDLVEGMRDAGFTVA